MHRCNETIKHHQASGRVEVIGSLPLFQLSGSPYKYRKTPREAHGRTKGTQGGPKEAHGSLTWCLAMHHLICRFMFVLPTEMAINAQQGSKP